MGRRERREEGWNQQDNPKISSICVNLLHDMYIYTHSTCDKLIGIKWLLGQRDWQKGYKMPLPQLQPHHCPSHEQQ